MTPEEYRAAAKRCAYLVRQLAYHRSKMETLRGELDELTQAMMLEGGG